MCITLIVFITLIFAFLSLCVALTIACNEGSIFLSGAVATACVAAIVGIFSLSSHSVTNIRLTNYEIIDNDASISVLAEGKAQTFYSAGAVRKIRSGVPIFKVVKVNHWGQTNILFSVKPIDN